jgi:hypothetical protein
MSDTRSEDTLMTLLALDAEDYSGESGVVAPSASLPKLDERIAMFAATFSGRDTAVTAEMRAAARDVILTAMAADLVDETTTLVSRPQDSRSAAAPVAFIRPRHAATRIPAQRSTQVSTQVPSHVLAGVLRGLQDLISSAAAPFTVRRLGMAAVPLVALIVAGSLWTPNWFNGTATPDQAAPYQVAPNQGLTTNAPPTRGLGQQPVDTAVEQNLGRVIAAEEAAHGRSDPAVAGKLVDLAGLYRADGRYTEAQALCERALIIQDQALGPKNPETIRTTQELAAIYRAQGRNKDADAILARGNQP